MFSLFYCSLCSGFYGDLYYMLLCPCLLQLGNFLRSIAQNPYPSRCVFMWTNHYTQGVCISLSTLGLFLVEYLQKAQTIRGALTCMHWFC